MQDNDLRERLAFNGLAVFRYSPHIVRKVSAHTLRFLRDRGGGRSGVVGTSSWHECRSTEPSDVPPPITSRGVVRLVPSVSDHAEPIGQFHTTVAEERVGEACRIVVVVAHGLTATRLVAVAVRHC